ncbi:PREDICTED: probable polyamine transporter At3g19553 [Tarenaya hassleriana]|uniref:probable polyamine transporter At3g19553 n=1 Tax=Tarenaya hassleriana TaxID=28532 RepID=UPI00053CA08C|nr:PREDICTED: probable polyamine transporter At3g19553 [Tarenaya hassleriana]XP_010519288.1 PREDICTED: probable polyamine transporter At3g19553 [Tarenaya hassleriana]XP_010519289.1 PREDICTED: probable polyamine transporter At3g19553 [Tarenaya hassleriana]
MGEQPISSNENGAETKPNPKITLLPLIFLIFYEVSGGPFGVEDSVKSGGGPLLALLGFLIFPLIWSLPEALITAELATSFPENGGYVVWISSAFGQFWGFQEGFWKWFSGVMDNALYPVLFLDYLKHSFPVFNLVAARVPALLGITFSLTYLNYRGLHIVGFSTVLLAIFSLCPFIVMALLSVPRISPKRWLVVDFRKVNWRGYFNTMFWNLNYWDKASTLAGEVENPGQTFPKALFGAVLLVICSYLVPLMAGTGALASSLSDEWSDGYFAQVGMAIGGVGLSVWIQAASALSNLGLFEAEMSSDAFQLLGMSEIGMLPAFFARRSKHGTPTISILCSATGVIFLSWLSFQEIIEFLNFLYALGMLLEFAAFVRLRIKKADLHRPYKVPLGTCGVALLCFPPSLLLILVMVLASLRTFLVSGAVILFGFCLYPFLSLVKEKRWLSFIPEEEMILTSDKSSSQPSDPGLGDESACLLP